MTATPDALILRGPPDRPAHALGATLAEALANALRGHGDRVALVHAETGESLTFAQLWTLSSRLAARLRALGVRSGEPVGVCAENCMEFAVVVLGTLLAGAAFAPVNPAYTTAELTHCLSISRPGLVFCTPSTAARIEHVRAHSTHIRHVVVMGEALIQGHVPMERLMALGTRVEPKIGTTWDTPQPAAVLCSSGTTGLPKGVTLSDRNILTCLGHITDPRFSSYTTDDVTLAVLPFFHAFGCVSLLGNLCAGVKTVLLPRFQDELFLRTIQDHKVVDPETGVAVGAHARGELCFRGPMVMAGYYGDERATAACTDAEGFLHSGDVGYYDAEGYFFVVDRLKELIKYKAFQVAPAELEAVLLTHPKVSDAAVVGVPDDDAGELPMAFVVLQNGSVATPKELADYVAERVSSSKRLRGGVRFLDAIPKTPSGKILRRELRAQLNAQLKARL